MAAAPTMSEISVAATDAATATALRYKFLAACLDTFCRDTRLGFEQIAAAVALTWLAAAEKTGWPRPAREGLERWLAGETARVRRVYGSPFGPGTTRPRPAAIAV